MKRLATSASVVIACFVSCAGCKNEQHSDAPDITSGTGVEDGGTAASSDRATCSNYFDRFAELQSSEEEAELLTEFGNWLSKHEYLIHVEMKEGKHVLSCPYFPPVTPWTEHTFLDVANLERLPRYKTP